jgi:hypothetical protein
VPIIGITIFTPDDKKTPAQASLAQAEYEKEIRPLLTQFCGGCHGDKGPSGGVSITAWGDVTTLQKDQTHGRKALTQIRERAMPPKGSPQPNEMQRDRLVQWMAHTLDNADESLLPKNPGRVLFHRLSRTEYNNTLRDLLGITSRPADTFPADGGGGGGFDNDANTMYIPPILMERYLETAGQALEEAKLAMLFRVKPGGKVTKVEAARQNISAFATRAFRRPIDTTEITRLLALFNSGTKRGETYEKAVKFALKAVLVSPSFLFRVETDKPVAAGSTAAALNDYELATRLSYFLWASMPDDELFRLAASKKLHTPAILDQQVRRMLLSLKCRDLSESFAGQWLRVRDLYTSRKPDPGRYPNYSPALRDAMYNEPVEFFAGLLRNDRPLIDLLDADYTYLNEDLAKFYGVPDVSGDKFRKVNLADHRRGGVLTMASVLTVTSYPQRTSPVLRGKWILESVLGSPPPPPPPNAGGLPADDAPKEGLTFRQRLEKHREKPQCAGCHARMDPLGFGLENFDGIGQWRTTIGNQPVDSAGILASGEKFSGPVEMKKILLSRKDEFTRNLTEKLLSYALGRGLEPYDIPAVKKITAAVAKDGYRTSTLVREIVNSYPFQYRMNG